MSVPSFLFQIWEAALARRALLDLRRSSEEMIEIWSGNGVSCLYGWLKSMWSIPTSVLSVLYGQGVDMETAAGRLSTGSSNGLDQFLELCGANLLVAEEDDSALGDQRGQIPDIRVGAQNIGNLELGGELGANDWGRVMMGVGKELGVFGRSGEGCGELIQSIDFGGGGSGLGDGLGRHRGGLDDDGCDCWGHCVDV